MSDPDSKPQVPKKDNALKQLSSSTAFKYDISKSNTTNEEQIQDHTSSVPIVRSTKNKPRMTDQEVREQMAKLLELKRKESLSKLTIEDKNRDQSLSPPELKYSDSLPEVLDQDEIEEPKKTEPVVKNGAPKSVIRTSALKRCLLSATRSSSTSNSNSEMESSSNNTQLHKLEILITGGAGFIGSHLVDSLMQNGHRITVIDDLSTGNLDNIGHWLSDPHFTFINHDIAQPLPDIVVDQIYHLASPASPKYFTANPIKTLRTNTVGTLNVLELAKNCKATVLVASTSEIYGDPIEHPQKESYWGNVNPVGPRSCYDEGKRVTESIAHSYSAKYNLDVKVARIFNTFGPRLQVEDGRVISNFIVQALTNEPLTVYGNGSQTRCFLFVSDLVFGLVDLMNSSFVGTMNLGSKNEITVLDLANKIIEKVSSTSGIIHHPLPQDDPKRRLPNTDRAEEHLEWFPIMTLDEGLDLTIKYYQNRKTHFICHW